MSSLNISQRPLFKEVKSHWEVYKFLAILISFFFSFFTLLCGIFSETIVQNNHDFLGLPGRHLKSNLSKSQYIEDIAATAALDNRRLYLFVLDCSKSIDEAKAPNWYHEIGETLKAESYSIEVKSNPSARDAADMSLYFLLRELVNNSNGSASDAGSVESRDDFAIWAVCGEGKKMFPVNDVKRSVSRASADEAISFMESKPETPNQDRTDFVKLFRAIRSTYSEAEDTHVSYYDMPNLIITILSDFSHDDGAPASNVEKSQRELEDEAQRLSSRKIMMNMIVLAKDSGDGDFGQVFSYFRKNMEWYRVNKEMLDGNIFGNGNKMLFPVFVARDPIFIHYDNSVQIDKEFVLSARNEGMVWLSLPSGVDSLTSERFSLQYGRVAVGQKAGQAEMLGRLVSGGDSTSLSIRQGEGIVFRYEGPLPTHPTSRMIKVSASFDRSSYLIPIHFVKRLPEWAAMLMLCLQVFTVLAAVSLVAILAVGFKKRLGA